VVCTYALFNTTVAVDRPLGILGKRWSDGNQPSTYKYDLLSSQLTTQVDTGVDVDRSNVQDSLRPLRLNRPPTRSDIVLILQRLVCCPFPPMRILILVLPQHTGGQKRIKISRF